jgi:hypothetical protein
MVMFITGVSEWSVQCPTSARGGYVDQGDVARKNNISSVKGQAWNLLAENIAHARMVYFSIMEATVSVESSYEQTLFIRFYPCFYP